MHGLRVSCVCSLSRGSSGYVLIGEIYVEKGGLICWVLEFSCRGVYVV